ncbi:MAG: hypothetical protein M3Q48_17290 [Actinomycetota bacterium]|nr:hypothetical protein [Actinomycetota bacterium]
MTDVGQDASLDLPPRLDLPLFVDALLKPGEPAHQDRLDGLVAEARPATVSGALRYRDGLPLLDVDAEGSVTGAILTWLPGREEQGYAAVSAFASRHEHRWLSTDATVVDGPALPVNVLRGRRPRRGSSTESYPEWSSVSEPAFSFALATVRRAAISDAAEPFAPAEHDDRAAWSLFYRLHSAYLLLWAAVERFALLAFGPAEVPMGRLDRLNNDPGFRSCAVAAGVAPSPKGADSADPYKRVKADGAGAIYGWYALRAHLGHGLRSPTYDGILLRRALVELHDTFRLHLAHRLPAVVARWELLEPEARAEQWLLRPLVAPAGLG